MPQQKEPDEQTETDKIVPGNDAKVFQLLSE